MKKNQAFLQGTYDQHAQLHVAWASDNEHDLLPMHPDVGFSQPAQVGHL